MRRFVIGAASASLVALAACTDNTANSLDPIGSPVYGVSQSVAGSNVPQGTVSFLTRGAVVPSDSIRATFQGLDSLENGYRYAAWVGDSAGTTFKPAPGFLITTRTDTALNAAGEPTVTVRVDTLGRVTSFQGKGPRTSMLYVTSPSVGGYAASDPTGVFLITIEATATATTPNADRRILFARRGANNASVRLNFGNFVGDVFKQYVFTTSGRGRVYVRDDVLQVSDSSLSRPPKGYFYAVYGVKRNAQNVASDTIYFGELHSPYPNRATSLRNADSLIVDASVQPPSAARIDAGNVMIIAGSVLTHSADITKLASATTNPYAGIAQILVTLESKHKTDARLGPAIVLTSDLPGIVRTPPETTTP